MKGAHAGCGGVALRFGEKARTQAVVADFRDEVQLVEEGVPAAKLDRVPEANRRIPSGCAPYVQAQYKAERRVSQEVGHRATAVWPAQRDLLKGMIGGHERQQRLKVLYTRPSDENLVHPAKGKPHGRPKREQRSRNE